MDAYRSKPRSLRRTWQRIVGHCPWTLSIAALAIIATAAWLAAGTSMIEYLAADADAVRHGQIWRLLTGPLVHATFDHLLWDISVLCMLGIACERRMARTWPPVVFAGLTIPTAVVILIHPDLTFYYGTSGLTYALMAAIVCRELMVVGPRWYLGLAGAALAFKVVRDTVTTSAIFMPTELGATVAKVPMAHVSGALIGALVVAIQLGLVGTRGRLSPVRR